MRGWATTAMVVLAVTGLSACNRGASNNATTAKNSAAPAAAPAVAAPAAGAAGMDDATFRNVFANGCAQRAQADANLPPGVDPSRLCGCVIETALTGRTGLYAYAASAAGEEAIAQATAQCAIQQAGGAAKAPAAEDAQDAAEEGEQ